MLLVASAGLCSDGLACLHRRGLLCSIGVEQLTYKSSSFWFSGVRVFMLSITCVHGLLSILVANSQVLQLLHAEVLFFCAYITHAALYPHHGRFEACQGLKQHIGSYEHTKSCYRAFSTTRADDANESSIERSQLQ